MTTGTMSTVTTRTRAPRTSPIVCAPWCEQMDGHADESGIEDQRCSTTLGAVTLTLLPQVACCSGSFEPHRITVGTWAGPLRAPAVLLFEWGEDAEYPLTADEARQIADLMYQAAALLSSGDLATRTPQRPWASARGRFGVFSPRWLVRMR